VDSARAPVDLRRRVHRQPRGTTRVCGRAGDDARVETAASTCEDTAPSTIPSTYCYREPASHPTRKGVHDR